MRTLGAFPKELAGLVADFGDLGAGFFFLEAI
jgi:hypothetical protein